MTEPSSEEEEEAITQEGHHDTCACESHIGTARGQARGQGTVGVAQHRDICGLKISNTTIIAVVLIVAIIFFPSLVYWIGTTIRWILPF